MQPRFVIPAFVLIGALAVNELAVRGQTVDPGDAVVLVTLDGARTEEIFGGLDLDILKSTLKDGQKIEDQSTYQRFWASTPDERRRKLMPFFWRLVTDEGSIAGDAALGSAAKLTNRRHFSYPGYAEILVGQALDGAITTNDPVRNPEETVLEGLRRKRGLSREQVATFASWNVFKAIAEHTEGATTVNAGDVPLGIPGADVALTSRLQRETGSPWDNTRLDAFTFNQAMAYLEQARPRVLYLALDETDDWPTTVVTTASSTRMREPIDGSSACGHGCRLSPTTVAARIS